MEGPYNDGCFVESPPFCMPDESKNYSVLIDPLIGRHVEIQSAGGIFYRGRVRSICNEDEKGELFVLCLVANPSDERLVYVTDRFTQIQDLG
jgi:hypothetical protein